ncbi:DNA repair protein rad52 [Coemansia sp. S146]|nr:DNA repair protein rad52 [Coemansia sp. S146]
MPKSVVQYVSSRDDDDNSKATPYTRREAHHIQSQLRRPLGPEHVSTRSGAGNVSLSYIEGWRVINIANQLFGFDGWSSRIQSFVIDYEIENEGRWTVGGSCLMRITLRNGTYREDMGYGMIENVKSLGMAYEKIKKEAVTDAIKRAMRQFGNALGNCVYDKEYVRTVKQVQKQPRNRLQGEDLFRYSDMVDEANCANLRPEHDGDSNGPSVSAAGAGAQSRTVAHDVGGMEDNQGAESVDFDMDDLDDDAFDGLGFMETDRPVIPESPSGAFDDRQAQYGNQPMQNTPNRVAASGAGWRPSSAPGMLSGVTGVRPGASPGVQVPMVSAQGPPSAARNLFCPPHPPRPAIPAQQAGSTTPSFRRPSFAEASGFAPSPQVASVLGARPQSASKNTSAPNGDPPNS